MCPASPQAHWRLAKCWFALRRFREAADACKSAARLAPDARLKETYEAGHEAALSAASRAEAARALLLSGKSIADGRPEEAAALFRRALAEDAGDVEARARLAEGCYALGRDAEAAEAALMGPTRPSLVAPEARPAAAELFVSAGRALRRLGRPADAAASLRLALDLAPDHAAAAEALAEAEREQAARPAGQAEAPGPLDPAASRVPRLPTGGALLSRHVNVQNHYLQYPFGNTAARPAAARAELERACAGAAGPARLLYIGVGDVRNVLRTCEEASGSGGGGGPALPLEFHLCDMDRCVLARDAAVLLAASRMGDPAPEDALFLWRLWFCLDMRPAQRRRLGALLAELAGAAASPEAWAASPFGAWLRVPCPGDLAILREVWLYWLSPGLPSLAEVRVQRHGHDLRCGSALAASGPGREPPRLRTNDAGLGGRRGEAARFAAGCPASGALPDAPRELADWFRALSASPDDDKPDHEPEPLELNPTLVTPPNGLCLVHYGLHPFRVFPTDELAAHSDGAAPAPLLALVPPENVKEAGADEEEEGGAIGELERPPRALSRAACRRLAAAAAAFAAAVAGNRASVRLYPGDGLQLCWEGASGGGAGALPSDARFDFIDTSNVVDNLCLAPLGSASQWVAEHAEPEEYLAGELGVHPALLPTLAGLRLATDLEALRVLERPPPRPELQPNNGALEVSVRWGRLAPSGPEAPLAMPEGCPLLAALPALAERCCWPRRGTPYLFALLARDLASRAADPAALLRAADAAIAPASPAAAPSAPRAPPSLGPAPAAPVGGAPAFDLIDADDAGGSAAFLVPAGLDATAARPDTVFALLAAESGAPLAPRGALPYPSLRRLPSPPVPRSALVLRAPLGAAPAPPTGVASVEESESGYAVRLAADGPGPLSVHMESDRVALIRLGAGGAAARVAFSHPVEPEQGFEPGSSEAGPGAGAPRAPSPPLSLSARRSPRSAPPLGARCASCGASDGLSCCARSVPPVLFSVLCKGVWYCGAACQRADWAQGHRPVCRAPAEQPAQPAPADPAGPAVLRFRKAPAADRVRLDLAALPEWGSDPESESVDEHLAAMYPSGPGEAGGFGSGTDLRDTLFFLFAQFAGEGVRSHAVLARGGRKAKPTLLEALAAAAAAAEGSRGLRTFEVSDGELGALRGLLAGNGRLVDPAGSAVELAGVPLRPSFLAPLYHRASLRQWDAAGSRPRPRPRPRVAPAPRRPGSSSGPRHSGPAAAAPVASS
eukprot:tig00000254_g22471.t1